MEQLPKENVLIWITSEFIQQVASSKYMGDLSKEEIAGIKLKMVANLREYIKKCADEILEYNELIDKNKDVLSPMQKNFGENSF